MEQKDCAAIILAAGSGSRMHSHTKKQYMELKGYPLVYYAIKAFEQFGFEQIVLVTGKEEIEYCRREIVDKYCFTKVTNIVPGGKERFDSVYEGLKAVNKAKYVFIHDGARPCLNGSTLQNCLDGVRKYGACIAAVPVKDTIKIADERGMVADTPQRSCVWSVQTPQVFEYNIIKNSFDSMYAKKDPAVTITDDAMVVENYSGYRVKLVMGSYENIKVTTPEDLIIAENYLDSK